MSEQEVQITKGINFWGKGIRGELKIVDSYFSSLSVELGIFSHSEGNNYGHEEIELFITSSMIKIKHDFERGRASFNDDYYHKSYKQEYEDRCGGAEGPIAWEDEFINKDEWYKKWLNNNLSEDDVKQMLRELLDYFINIYDDNNSDDKREDRFDDGKEFIIKILKLTKKFINGINDVEIE